MTKKKVGLVLGGGAARGFAHIGVLTILEKEGIPIDVVAGTSAGAVVGALYASGMNPSRMTELAKGYDWNRRRHLLDLSLHRTGFIEGGRLVKEIKDLLGGDLKIEELNKPFACVACDLMNGEDIIMAKGSVAEAIHASIAIPVLFEAVKRNGRFLIDGGLVNQVPVNVAKALGADYIIAVNVFRHFTHRLKTRLGELGIPEKENNRRPNIATIMLNIIEIANSSQIEASLENADVVIEPHMGSIGPADFNKSG
jgi:NTE family protein